MRQECVTSGVPESCCGRVADSRRGMPGQDDSVRCGAESLSKTDIPLGSRVGSSGGRGEVFPSPHVPPVVATALTRVTATAAGGLVTFSLLCHWVEGGGAE